MAFVQTANSGTPSGTATSKTATFAAAQTAGNLNVVVIVNGSASNTTPPNLITLVTDTLGNTYAASNTWLTCASGASGAGQIIYHAPNIHAAGAGANTVTVTTSAAVPYFSVTIAEYSGLATASPVDVVAGNKQDGSGTSTASTGSLTTTVASDTLFGSIAFFDGPNSTPALTAGFTLRASYYTQLAADRVGVATGSYSMSAQSAGSSGWAAQLVAFKASGGAALTFPMAMADATAVTALGLRVNRRFSFVAADASVVTALGLRVSRRFPFTATDTSVVTALGLRVNRRFPFAVADSSLVTALGLSVGRRFPLAVTDISVVTVLGFRTNRRFPVHAADISTVVFLGNPSPNIRFPFGIADVSIVTALGYTRSAPGMVFAGSKVSPGGVPGVGVTAGTWINLSLGTGWTAPVLGQYQIQISGTTTMVYFRGMIQAAYSALGTTTAFTVPVGARPSMACFCVLGGAQDTGAPSDVASYLATVSSSGVCVIYFLSGAALTWADPTKTQQVYLNGLNYSL